MSKPSNVQKPNWLVFADDWGRHPSSCQYLIRELMDRVDVTWVDTIGMRTPRLDLATVRRVAGKVRATISSSSPVSSESDFPTNEKTGTMSHEVPIVLRPLMWPWFTRQHDRAFNRRLLASKLKPIVERWPHPRVLVTTIPIVADIVDDLPVDRSVYYCVDDFSVWPGLDQRTMLTMEASLVDKVNRVVASSEVLVDRMQGRNADVELLTHGVDLKKWAKADRFDWSIARSVADAQPILFWGIVDPRLDMDFVAAISKACHDRSIVFVGPQQNPNPRLKELSNVVLLPSVSPDVLASMAQSSGCLIMPYVDSDATRAMQPLKLNEYLATGRPVIARSLPSTEVWRDACDVASTPVDFSQAVVRRLEVGVSSDQLRARERLSTESWSNKAETFYRMVSEA